MIEHYAGKFPLWLAPVQARIIPIGDAHHKEAVAVRDALLDAGSRAEADLGHDSFGKKIRAAKTEHVPYFIIIGDKDIAAGKITLESRDRGQVGQITKEELVATLAEEIKSKK